MEQYAINGGNPLVGEVEIGGAKNAALPILAASLMTDETVLIENMPDVRDTNILLDAMAGIGTHVERIDRHTVKINGSLIHDLTVNGDSVKKIRASYYFLGALLGKYKKATVVLPGGCDIGCRAIDQHIKGFKALGATVEIAHGMITAEASHLCGAHIYLDVVSVGATINIMMAAALAEGRTTIENAAKEPHIVDVANFLNTMGADIRGAGTDIIKINGVKSLHGNATYSVVPDQIEAGTFMLAAVASKGDVTIKNCITKHLECVTAKILEIGAHVEDIDGDTLRVWTSKRPTKATIKTAPYPGFPTDLQPQMGVVLSIANGTSIINESIWDSRFQYTAELNKMGANITASGKSAVFQGVNELSAAPVYSSDLRAGAALIIAGTIAKGKTEVYNLEHIDRGYEHIEDKFRQLGAKIERVSE